jgi:hypothetical protein
MLGLSDRWFCAGSTNVEILMDRRLFVTGLLGLASATALASVAGPVNALAGVPTGRGILDELDTPETDLFEEDDADVEAEPIHHRPGHKRRRRRRRRREWRRHCRRYRHNGRWRRRCRRRRVWVWYWYWY